MRKSKLFITMLLTVLTFSMSIAQNMKYSRVKIPIEQQNIKYLAEKGLAVDFGVRYKDGHLTGEFSQRDLMILKENNFTFEIIIDDLSKYYREKIEKSGVVVRSDKTPVNFNLGSMGGNLTYDEMISELDDMRALYPDLISAKQTITDDYTTHDGNSLHWVRISDNPDIDEDNEPEVLYTGLHHAREPLSMMQMIYIMWYMLEDYENGGENQYLIDNFEMYFVPCINVDGYKYNELTDPNGGGMWRKNRKNNGNGSYGVDLNRNYGFMWGYDNTGSSGDTSSDTYRGTEAFSEPETQMIKEFVEAHEFLLAHNHHTYSNLLIYPWGYESINTPEPDETIFDNYAAIMTRENGYTAGHGWEILYTVNGEACDWMYGEQTTKNKIFAFTQETGDEFWPETNEVIPLCEENIESNLFLTRLAGLYAEVSDLSPYYMPKYGYIDFDIHFIGLDTIGTFEVAISGNDFEQIGENVPFSDFNMFEHRQGEIYYQLNDNLNIGDEFTFNIEVNNGLYTFTKTFTKIIGKTNSIFEDPGNDLNNWTSSVWSVTDEAFHSEISSITDSEGGNYQNNINNEITLTNPIDLSGYTSANVDYWAKWNIETGWDYAQFFVSNNGGTSWTPLTTNNTSPGSGSFQPTGEPVYDGNSEWINETVDLSEYLTDNVKFKFKIATDVNTTADGFYFDDFSVVNLETTNIQPVISGQENLYCQLNQTIELNVSDLIIDDPDSNFPDDFILIVYQGENYTFDGTVITPSSEYAGTLSIPIKVNDGFDYSDIFNLTVNVALSVENLEKNIDIIPNPANNNFTVIFDGQSYDKIQILDVTGKIIKDIFDTSSGKVLINSENFKSGIYFVRLTGKNIINKKIVINH